MELTCQAPTRVDLAGGTLDLWPLHHLLDHKATVNVAVGLEATVHLSLAEQGVYRLESQDQDRVWSGPFEELATNDTLPLPGLLMQALWNRELPALQLTTSAQSPAGAGLGGSSCLAVAVAEALHHAGKQLGATGLAIEDRQLVQTVQDVEARLIHAPTGCQDYWGAVRGGLNLITYPYGGEAVETLKNELLTELSQQMLLCYSGKSRDSALNNWEIFKKAFDRDATTLATLNQMGGAAEECATALRAGNCKKALEWSHREWQLRTSLWPGIETAETRALDEAARQAGAHFTRICGAGGGGVMAVFAPPDTHDEVKAALETAGGRMLDAAPVRNGVRVRAS